MIFTFSSSSRVALASLSLSAFTGCATTATPLPEATATQPRLMAPQDLQALPSKPADLRVSYGSDSSQYGDLRIPPGPGPHPVAILIHGGCFKAEYATSRDMAPMADALKEKGIASWNIEYRRLGQPGGGWPGTYLDVARAADYLRTLAPQHNLDLGHVVVVGHSAGGPLAMWTASRARVPASSAIYVANPLPIRGVVDLAGPFDLAANSARYHELCHDSVITALLGGTTAEVPNRYAEASPAKLLPLGIAQVIVIGQYEELDPRPLAEAYVQAATRAGDKARLLVVPGAGHFELASPLATGWPQVEAAIHALLDGKLR